MVDAKPTDWREKYLNLIETQERQEKDNEALIEQMRRALVRVSLAADGMDSELDKVLEALRDHLKTGNQSHLKNRLEVVEDAVIAFDERKQQRQVQLLWSLESISEHLQRLLLKRDIAKQLKEFNKTVKQRSKQFEELPHLLRELAEIQAEVLNELELKKPGLFEKISEFAGKIKTEKPEDTNISVNETIEGHFETAESDENDVVAAGEVIPERLHQPAIDLAVIAERVANILRQLLDDIKPAEHVEQKITNARARIQRGLRWTDLVPTLEDVRDLILYSQMSAHDEFSRYLSGVNKELIEIVKLASASAGQAESEHLEQQEFKRAVSSQIKAMETSVGMANNLENLKEELNDYVKQIRAAMERPVNKKSSLSEQIKELLNQVENLEQESQRTFAKLSEEKQKALHDTLTGLPNREAYLQRSNMEIKRWQRYKNPLAMAVVDIDLFKNINDGFGHQVGDKVLKLVSHKLKSSLREVDFIARYGGEEFVILLPQTTAEAALPTLDKLREAIAQTPFHFKKQPVRITVSIGVSSLKEGDNLETAFARADKALYNAKNSGRNRCELLL